MQCTAISTWEGLIAIPLFFSLQCCFDLGMGCDVALFHVLVPLCAPFLEKFVFMLNDRESNALSHAKRRKTKHEN